MKVSKKNITKWANVLRSGKYTQSMLILQDQIGFCCLGVACKIFAKNYLKDLDGYLKGSLPVGRDGSPDWLVNINKSFEIRTGKFLSTLNDIDDFSFDEIADCLEAVYIHEVLELRE